MRFEYEYCRQINAELRGLPWPPPEQVLCQAEEIAVDGPFLADGDDIAIEDAFDCNGSTESSQHTRSAHENDDVDTDVDEEPQSSQENSSQDSQDDSQVSTSSASSPATALTESVCSTASDTGDGNKDAEFKGGPHGDGDLDGSNTMNLVTSTTPPPEDAQDPEKTHEFVLKVCIEYHNSYQFCILTRHLIQDHVREITHHQIVKAC